MGSPSNEAPAAQQPGAFDGFSSSPVCTLPRPRTIHGRGCRSTAMQHPSSLTCSAAVLSSARDTMSATAPAARYTIVTIRISVLR